MPAVVSMARRPATAMHRSVSSASMTSSGVRRVWNRRNRPLESSQRRGEKPISASAPLRRALIGVGRKDDQV